MDIFEKKYKLWINALFFAGILLVFLPTKFDRSKYSGISIPIISPTDFTQSTASPTHLLTNTISLPEGFYISSVTPDIEARISGISYAEGCPLPLSELRYLTVLHIGFDGLTYQGELIIHEEIAGVILEIFYQLYLSGYPIEKIRLIDEYSADDEASMTDNNTSGFCWRTITGTDSLSLHGYGLAIDINPLYNPYICDGIVSPASSPYDHETGKGIPPYFMTADDLCVRLFKSYGFIWGGDWESPKDYQHFEYGKTAAR